ncbi:MAG: DoxX family protein [Bacteroidetes bacterium]|nr:DoxX family protein [Bacteroidota bacterium]
MKILIIMAQFTVGLSVIYVWIFRFHNVLAEFKLFGLGDTTRNFVGASKIALATLLMAGAWCPELVQNAAFLMGGFMLAAQFFHFKVKRPMVKRLPSLILLLLCIFIATGKV